MTLEAKRVPAVPDESGAFSARVYVIEGPPDGDGDVILRGAIEDGARVTVSAQGHDVLTEGAEPAGEARLYEGGNAVVAIGVAFDTARGRLLRQKLREPGVEWSVGYRVLSSRRPTTEERERHPATRRIITRWAVDEISPVTVGSCGPTCATLVSKGATCAGPCCGEDVREAAVRELARFEKTRARLFFTAAQSTLDELRELYKRELSSASVPAEIRAAAAEGAELAAAVLGAKAAPTVRWFSSGDYPATLGIHFGAEGATTIWIAARSDAAGVFKTGVHETYHALRGPDEALARRFADSLALLRDVELHVGPRKTFEGGELVVEHPIPGLVSSWRRAGLSPGALVVDAGVLYERQEDLDWRRVAALMG